MNKENFIMQFGNVSIRDDEITDSHGKRYTVFIIHDQEKNEYDQYSVTTKDEDLLILMALSLKHEGTNGEFAFYASRMLDITGDVWR